MNPDPNRSLSVETPERQPVSFRSGPFVLGAKAVVTVALLGLVFSNVDVVPVFGRLTDIDWTLASAAAVALAGQLLITAVRWHRVCALLGISVKRAQAVHLMWIGHFFSQTLPSGVGGDAVRAWLLSRLGTSIRGAVSVVFCDRIFSLGVLLLLTCLTLPLYLDRVANPEARLVLPAAFAALTAGMLTIAALGPTLLSRFARFRLGKTVHLMSADLQRVFFGSRASLVLLALAAAGHGGLILSCFALARALDIPLAFFDCVIIIPPVMLAAVLPISIAGWGVREGAMVAGLGVLGIPMDSALSLSITFGLLQIALAIPGGILWALWTRGSNKTT